MPRPSVHGKVKERLAEAVKSELPDHRIGRVTPTSRVPGAETYEVEAHPPEGGIGPQRCVLRKLPSGKYVCQIMP